MKEKYRNPLYLLIWTTVYLFVSEASVMIMLAFLPDLPVWVNALADGVLLALLALPILYFFLFKPLLHHISTREKAESIPKVTSAKRKTKLNHAEYGNWASA